MMRCRVGEALNVGYLGLPCRRDDPRRGAAKVGIADTAGSRPGGASPGRLADPGGIPGHRQGPAIAIETDILGWWRGELGLPSYLSSGPDAPRADGRRPLPPAGIDLAATVEHVCELALRPEARPAALASRAQLPPAFPSQTRLSSPPGVKLPELDPWGREF